MIKKIDGLYFYKMEEASVVLKKMICMFCNELLSSSTWSHTKKKFLNQRKESTEQGNGMSAQWVWTNVNQEIIDNLILVVGN